ncbi:DUF881 domain-containing protein [Dermatophilaceae bacterium Soc4.6]
MTLLSEILERPLDPGYATAAQRRATTGGPASRGTRTVLVATTALLIGFLLAASALTLRPRGTTASRDKQQLIDQVHVRQEHGDEQVAAIERLRAQITASRDAAIGASAVGLTQSLRELSVTTGDVAVQGPGLTVTLQDAPDAVAGTGQPRGADTAQEGRVTSTDLQIVVNGLWQAGAEAMAVNGQRLTARSAIRFAGQAILVDYRPLSPPYVITAIGDQQGLPVQFAQTVGGSYLTALRDNYAIPSSTSSDAHLVVPRSPTLGVDRAGPPTPPSAPGTPSTAARIPDPEVTP